MIPVIKAPRQKVAKRSSVTTIANLTVVNSGHWISLGGVVIAGGSAIWSVRSAHKAGKAQVEAEAQAQRATKAAEQSAAAEGRSAVAAERSATALEQQNRSVEDQAELTEGVPWRLEYDAGSTYELCNDTETPKFHVSISGDGVLRAKTVERIDGRSATDFMGFDAMGRGDQVAVSWHRREDKSDQARSWTGREPSKR